MITSKLLQSVQSGVPKLRVASSDSSQATPQATLNTFLKAIRTEDVPSFQACIARHPNSKHLKRAKKDPEYAMDLIEKLQLMPRVSLYQTSDGEYRARTYIGSQWVDVYKFVEEGESIWFIAAAD